MKVLFHHFAKTAGTSVAASFKRHGLERICPMRYDYEMTPELMTSSSRNFYRGHFSFANLVEFRQLNPGCFVCTFVPNPYNRVISRYHNWTDRWHPEFHFRALIPAMQS